VLKPTPAPEPAWENPFRDFEGNGTGSRESSSETARLPLRAAPEKVREPVGDDARRRRAGPQVRVVHPCG